MWLTCKCQCCQQDCESHQPQTQLLGRHDSPRFPRSPTGTNTKTLARCTRDPETLARCTRDPETLARCTRDPDRREERGSRGEWLEERRGEEEGGGGHMHKCLQWKLSHGRGGCGQQPTEAGLSFQLAGRGGGGWGRAGGGGGQGGVALSLLLLLSERSCVPEVLFHLC